MNETEQRRDELLGYVHDLMRHLSKQDTLYDAGFFGYDEGEDGSRWNNDTVVLALELIVRDWLQAHWGMTYTPYCEVGRGLAPAIPETLRALGLLDRTP